MEIQNGEQDKNIIISHPVDYILHPRGIGYIFYQSMLQNKDKLAQIYGPTGEKDTHGEVLQRSVRIAIAMENLGVKPGDFISVCTYNHLDSCTPVIASIFIRAITAALDPTLSLQDVIYLLTQTPPKVIFVNTEALPMIEKAVESLKFDTNIVVFGNTTRHIPFSEMLQPSDEEITFTPRIPESLEETAIVYFTSGTSGLPKAVRLSNHSLLFGFTRIIPNTGYNASLMLSYASPYWSVFLGFVSVSILSGNARLVYPKYDPEYAWHIFKYKLTLIFFNYIQILSMLNLGRPDNVDISTVEDITLGGGCLQLEQMLKIKKLFPETRVHLMFGMSEVASSVLSFKPSNRDDLKFISTKPTSSGRPLPGISYKIVDLETEKTLGPNQRGELCIKAKSMLSGYVNQDSSEEWDSDGWFRTGDIAYYDEDKCFYIVDRTKEMFKYQCWHISPAVLEGVVLTHPAVAMATVIGKPHEIDGDHPMAIVKLKSGLEIPAEEIEKFVEERVHDRQKLRAGVKFVDDFPILPSGKVNRKILKQTFC